MLTHYLERILDAKSVDQIRAAYLEATTTFGFTNAFYVARFMLDLPSSLTQDHSVIITNLPAAVIERVQTARAGDTPLWAQWVSRNNGEISSEALIALICPDPDNPPNELRAIRQAGLEAAQFLSLRDKVLRSIGAVVLNPWLGATHQDVAERWQDRGRELRTLSWVMHMRLATMPRANLQLRLTPRQREVLEWRSAGKTVGEIATIIGVTPATVEKHMRLAREALGVQTTPQAILKAHLAHELFPQGRTENPFG